jgi:hypothetical protein
LAEAFLAIHVVGPELKSSFLADDQDLVKRVLMVWC